MRYAEALQHLKFGRAVACVQRAESVRKERLEVLFSASSAAYAVNGFYRGTGDGGRGTGDVLLSRFARQFFFQQLFVVQVGVVAVESD